MVSIEPATTRRTSETKGSVAMYNIHHVMKRNRFQAQRSKHSLFKLLLIPEPTALNHRFFPRNRSLQHRLRNSTAVAISSSHLPSVARICKCTHNCREFGYHRTGKKHAGTEKGFPLEKKCGILMPIALCLLLPLQ